MTTWHVATTGRDSAAGTEAAPLRTIKAGIAKLKPGDVVLVAPGTYAEAVAIDKSGSAAGGDVALRSAVKGGALIRPPAGSWNAVNIYANYVAIDGFDVMPQPKRGDGIEGNGVHHISVLNNVVHGAGESGIQFNWSEFIRIEGNECYENAYSGWFSGISVYQCRQIAGDTTSTGFRTIIRGNVSHHNLSVDGNGGHADGNGIIVDDMNHTQATNGNTPAGTVPPYPYPALVENNLAYANGGKGIVVNLSDRTTVRRNTSAGNLRDPVDAKGNDTWRGDLHVQSSRDCLIEANVAVYDPAVGHPNGTALGACGGENVRNTWQGNVSWAGVAGKASVRRDPTANNPVPSGTNRLAVDPKLVSYVPTAAGMAEIGWRPAATPTPEPEEDMSAKLDALKAAFDAYATETEGRFAALEARPTDPEIAGRVAAAEAEIEALKTFDQKVKAAAAALIAAPGVDL